jgi:hypothetical protein
MPKFTDAEIDIVSPYASGYVKVRIGVRDTPSLSTRLSSAMRDPAGKSHARIISRKRNWARTA